MGEYFPRRHSLASAQIIPIPTAITATDPTTIPAICPPDNPLIINKINYTNVICVSLDKINVRLLCKNIMIQNN